MLYRQWMYEPGKARPTDAEAIITKNREGTTGRVSLSFEGQFSRFLDADLDNEAGAA